MNFLLSAEQQQLQSELSKVLADACSSRDLHALIDGDEETSRAAWRRLSDFGALAICVPVEHGGLGLELIDLALVAETLGRAGAGVPFLGHALATLAICWGGDEQQKAKWLPALASGEAIGTVAFSEGDERWLPDDWTTPATDRLNGEKRNVPAAREAQVAVVGVGGGRLALVDLTQGGVEIMRIVGVDRTRPLDTVRFTDVPVEWLSGDGELAARVCDAGLILLAADAFGGADHCIAMAVEYANTREQFGVKIGQFQALRHQLANMALLTEPCRGLYWYAAHAFDHRPEASRHAAAQAKAYIAEIYMQVSRDALEAHGGIGFTWEFDSHIWLKRAMFDWSWLGSPARHRARAAEAAGW